MNNTFYIIPRIGGIAYLNIAKSACSSILLGLSRMRLKNEFEPPRKLLPDGSEPIHGFSNTYSHTEYFFCRWPIDFPPLPESFIKFSFVRNPYDRFYSFYKSKIVNGQSPGKFYERFGIFKGCSFSDCVRRLTSVDPKKLEHHSVPQSKLIYDGKNLLVDYIGKVENLKSDWKIVQEISGYDLELEFANVTENSKLPVYSKECKERIYQYYKDDFELFGYDKDSVETNDYDENIPPKQVYIKHYLQKDEIIRLRDSLYHNNEIMREKAESFNKYPEKREYFFYSQNEIFNELILKNISFLNEKIRNLHRELKEYNVLGNYKTDGTDIEESVLESDEFKKHIAAIKIYRKLNGSIEKIEALFRETQRKIEVLKINTYENLEQCKQKIDEKSNEDNINKEEIKSLKKAITKINLSTYAVARRSFFKRLLRFFDYRIINDIKFIKKHGLVDPHFYYSKYPDTIAAGFSAAEHYVRYGVQEGRNPSDNFNTLQYMMENPEVAQKGINPLIHNYLNR